jgi:hypothetical protein
VANKRPLDGYFWSRAAKHANWHFNLLADDLESNVWNVRVAILEALKSFFAKLHVASAEGKQGKARQADSTDRSPNPLRSRLATRVNRCTLTCVAVQGC